MKCREIWRRRAVMCVGSLVILLSTGCAKRGPAPVGGQTGAPHLGWVIMSGDRDNPDRDFVCQSNPRSECVATVDRPDARVLAHVYFYYHAGATETKYSGSTRIGFFDTPHDLTANATVKAGDSPGNQSVSGFTSSKPGTYNMTIAVVATAAPSGAVTQIREEVPVTLK